MPRSGQLAQNIIIDIPSIDDIVLLLCMSAKHSSWCHSGFEMVIGSDCRLVLVIQALKYLLQHFCFYFKVKILEIFFRELLMFFGGRGCFPLPLCNFNSFLK